MSKILPIILAICISISPIFPKAKSKIENVLGVEIGDILVDFEARTGHNHGTKFRFRNNKLPELYKEVEVI